MRTKSNNDLANALKLLESASRHKRDELRSAVNGKYESLKELFQEKEDGFLRSWANTKEKAMDAAEHFEDTSRRKLIAAGREVDRTVSGHPWIAVAGTAAISLVLGFVFSRNCRD